MPVWETRVSYRAGSKVVFNSMALVSKW